MSKTILRDRLLTDPEFKKHRREVFYDLDFLRQSGRVYTGVGLVAPG